MPLSDIRTYILIDLEVSFHTSDTTDKHNYIVDIHKVLRIKLHRYLPNHSSRRRSWEFQSTKTKIERVLGEKP